MLVDGESNNIVGQVELGGWPGAPLALPELHRLYVPNEELCCLQAVRTGAGGVEELGSASPKAARHATIVRGCLRLSSATGLLLDVAGRKVADLKSGTNNVSGIRTGIYFVQESRGLPRKVLILAK